MTNTTLTASAATRTAMQIPASWPANPPVGWLHLDAPDLDVPCRRTLSLVWRADAYRPAAARALTEFAAGYFRTWRGDA